MVEATEITLAHLMAQKAEEKPDLDVLTFPETGVLGGGVRICGNRAVLNRF